ncbi:MAG TPA: MFS transporter [Burkholderiaceae bacterium]
MRKSGRPILGIRWFMVALVTAGLVVNYLARNTLSVAAPTLKLELNIGEAQYSYVVFAWQVCYAAMQPVAGFLLDALGTKIGFTLFALAWSLACACASLATGWQSMAVFRGLLGLAEAAGIPAGVKATTEWFPAQERSVAIGWFNIGSSIGALCAPPLVVWALVHGNWRWAFVMVGVLGLIWVGLWAGLYRHPQCQKRLSEEERHYILSGQEAKYHDGNAVKASLPELVANPNFWSLAVPRFLSEPAWQTFNAWIPLYMATERHMNLTEIAMFAWLPFLAADIGCVLGGYLSPLFQRFARVPLFASRKLVLALGALCMIGPASIGLVDSPYAAIALLCVGGFAHQILSGALYSITSDVFGKNDVATATGLLGMSGYLGAALFTLLFGYLVTRIGYSPLFLLLAIFDFVAAAIVGLFVHQAGGTPAPVAEAA